MVKALNLEDILFLDIETVPQFRYFHQLDVASQSLWEEKSRYQRKDDISAEDFYERAAIWAEFGKIVCISVGHFVLRGEARKFRVTSFYGNEVEILSNFGNLLESYFCRSNHLLCAHNGKEFDFPYISRRMIINGVDLPSKLNLFGKKPWEIPHLDTMELWKFGDYKAYTSLKLMAHVLGISSPKDDIDGSEVYSVFYEKRDIERIVRYCEKDTITVAQILLKLRNESLLSEDEILYV